MGTASDLVYYTREVEGDRLVMTYECSESVTSIQVITTSGSMTEEDCRELGFVEHLRRCGAHPVGETSLVQGPYVVH